MLRRNKSLRTLLVFSSNVEIKVPFFPTFVGNIIKDKISRTHVREIPNTNFLVSLHYSFGNANLEIFHCQRGIVKKVYAFEEFLGTNSKFYSFFASFHLL